MYEVFHLKQLDILAFVPLDEVLALGEVSDRCANRIAVLD